MHAQYTLGTCSVAVQCETWNGVMPASSACILIPPRVFHFSAFILNMLQQNIQLRVQIHVYAHSCSLAIMLCIALATMMLAILKRHC